VSWRILVITQLTTTRAWSGYYRRSILVVGDALFDPRHKFRRVVLHHLSDVGPKLVEDVNAPSLPIVEPKVLKVAELERLQYGR
jgi:hypothetical protein